MATKPQPWPRKASKHRQKAVSAAMEILVIMRPLLKDPRYRNDPLIMAIVASASYQARDIVDLLTSIPAEDEH